MTGSNWVTVVTSKKTPVVQGHSEPEMASKRTVLSGRWFSTNDYPSEEVSILAPEEVIYLGRYPEGVVLRLGEDDKNVTFLTNAMAAELARKLLPS